ncbi:glycosyltransferase [Terrisporobacter glycolicus]|uniref:glycosyltransferase n=1 Tax=Terrisporobacter glycolicus TaxID=36841 RepID=UPI000AAA493E
MKVSIIVPVYNVEKYLEECLDSVVNQTLKNIEIICINDGSTDGSLGILNKYKKKYSNIKIINQDNAGLSAARNAGIREAKGEYIYFLDSDDYIELNAMKICYECSKKDNLDVLTFDADSFFDKDYIGDKNKEIYDRNHVIPKYIMTGKEFYTISNMYKSYYAPVWLNFYSCDFIKNNELMFKEGVVHEDEIHTPQTLFKAQKVKYISNKFFNRRIRSNSIMTAGLNIRHVEGNFEIIKSLYELYLENQNENNYELVETLKKNINMHIISTLHRCDSLNYKEVRDDVVKFIRKISNVVDINSEILVENPGLYYSNAKKISRNNELELYKKNKKIFYMLIPTHGNLGDQAIVYASEKFLEDKYPDYKIIKINLDETELYIEKVKEIISCDDIVFLHGGGNMGNHYIWEEQARRYVISKLDNAKIISFTQTIFFSGDYEGKKELDISKQIYNNHKDLTLLAREEKSYELMKESFYNCNVFLCPDIVFYLNNKINNKQEERKYLMTCLRKDKETYYTLNKKEAIISEIGRKFELIKADTIVDYGVDHINRKEELANIWRKFCGSKVVITDRLHGMIFAAITQTPCIVLRSLDYKVTQSYKWIENLNYIKLTDDFSLENIEKLIVELEKIENYDQFEFDKTYFDGIVRKINKDDNNFIYNMKNEKKFIEIDDIVIDNNCIEYHMNISGELIKYFNYSLMKIEYEEDLTEIPKSIAVIPMLANILPISWFTNSDIIIDELDDVFYESIGNMKKAYENMFKMKLGGNIIVNNIICNKYKTKDNECITLFSGGADSLATVIRQIDKKPILATIWGADVDCNNIDGWNYVKDAVLDIGCKFKLKNIFIKSDFRKCINETQLDILCREMTGCIWWWESMQHGMALISHLVPYAYKNKLNTIFIPGTLSYGDIKKYGRAKLASDPTIDNEFRFASCFTIHEGFNYNRNDKIKIISDYKNEIKKKFDIRVCFSSHNGQNCNMCRKCSITILSLIQQKQDPNKFGFNVDESLLIKMKYKYENEFIFAKFALEWWKDIKNKFLQEEEFWKQYPHISWIMYIDTSDEYNENKKLQLSR